MNSNHILLLSPYSTIRGAALGIGYIHAYLEIHQFFVESLFLDINDQSTTILHNTIKKIQPAIIGIQILTESRLYAFKIIQEIHLHYPQIAIIIGGVHATAMHEQIIHAYPFVFAVIGEGERAFFEIAAAISKKESLNEIQGIAFMENDTYIKTPARELLQDLDSLPFPKHSLFIDNRTHATSILTSRGCPFHCSFCCTYTDQTLRFRSIDNVIQELLFIKNQFPAVQTINILDSNFLIDQTRAISFCDAVIEKGLIFKFICSGRFSTNYDEYTIKKLEAAGFIVVAFGLESANKFILQKAHKEISKTEIVKTALLFSKTKISLHLNIIVGLPGETKETIQETARFIQALQKIKYIVFSKYPCVIALVFPETELYTHMKKAYHLSDNIWLKAPATIPYTVEYTEKELLHMRRELLTYISLDYLFSLKGFFRQFIIVIKSTERQRIFRLAYKQFLSRASSLAKKIKLFSLEKDNSKLPQT